MITVTLDKTGLLVVAGLLLLLIWSRQSGRGGCQTLSGCLIGLVCIAIGIGLWLAQAWIGD